MSLIYIYNLCVVQMYCTQDKDYLSLSIMSGRMNDMALHVLNKKLFSLVIVYGQGLFWSKGEHLNRFTHRHHHHLV